MMHHRSLRPSLAALLALALLAGAPAARADVTQPDGTPIPQWGILQGVFNDRGESAIDAMRDAAVTPERFVPGCRVRFRLVSRGHAIYRNAFGWYNATGARPADDDLHVLIPCDAPVGTVATLDLAHEPAYRGGEVGFFLRTTETAGACATVGSGGGYTYFTERRFNPDNHGDNSYVHLLIYDSRVSPATFYFAWEDLFTGGNNDFADFVAQVGNIECSGAGAPCDTGRPGICGAGTRQCRAGVLSCVGWTQPRAETCDGLDDDCNGVVDDGPAVCPAGFVCDRGRCVGRCVEDSCFAGFSCSAAGTCIENGCDAVSCPAGQVCEAGRCVGACDGVVCPAGQVCRVGRCLDPCAGVVCDDDQVCADGTCRARCQCRPCAPDQTCGADGRCTPTACVGVSCPAGQVCVAGACRDRCDGVVCPRGEACRDGACARGPVGDVDVDAGHPTVDAGLADARADAAPRDGAGGFPPNSAPGCGCATAHARSAGARGVAVLAALGVALALARRRTRRPPARAPIPRDAAAARE